MRAPFVALLAVCAVLAPACDGDDAAEDAAGSGDTEITVTTLPPSPFCEAIDRLEEAVNESSTDDDRQTIVAAYTEMLAMVPAEVRADFEAVLARLRSAPATTTTTPPSTVPITGRPTTSTSSTTTTTSSTASDSSTDPQNSSPGSTQLGPGSVPQETPPGGTLDFEEGYSPSDEPATRINAYVEFACDRSDNNPGPPPTEPETPAPTTEP